MPRRWPVTPGTSRAVEMNIYTKVLMPTTSSRVSKARTKNPLGRARKIKLIIFDVDGVLTDGKLYFVPLPAGTQPSSEALALQTQAAKHAGQPGFGLSSPGTIEVKAFHAHDGTAISLARLAGIRTGIITKRISETVAQRARDLKIDYVYQGIADKLSALEEMCERAGIERDQAAMVGDDVIDLPVMRHCGLAIAVGNARPDVKREAHLVVKTRGGEGAARDAVEYILKAQRVLQRVVSEYICERSPKDSGKDNRPGKDKDKGRMLGKRVAKRRS